jgi:hypothetical protein
LAQAKARLGGKSLAPIRRPMIRPNRLLLRHDAGVLPLADMDELLRRRTDDRFDRRCDSASSGAVLKNA